MFLGVKSWIFISDLHTATQNVVLPSRMKINYWHQISIKAWLLFCFTCWRAMTRAGFTKTQVVSQMVSRLRVASLHPERSELNVDDVDPKHKKRPESTWRDLRVLGEFVDVQRGGKRSCASDHGVISFSSCKQLQLWKGQVFWAPEANLLISNYLSLQKSWNC